MTDDPLSKLVDPLSEDELHEIVSGGKPTYIPRPKVTQTEQVEEGPADLLQIFGA